MIKDLNEIDFKTQQGRLLLVAISIMSQSEKIIIFGHEYKYLTPEQILMFLQSKALQSYSDHLQMIEDEKNKAELNNQAMEARPNAINNFEDALSDLIITHELEGKAMMPAKTVANFLTRMLYHLGAAIRFANNTGNAVKEAPTNFRNSANS